MAHETTVHRVDAEQAVGRPVAPVPPGLAVDGIDEIFSVFVAALGQGRSPGDGRTVHLHATDAEGEWLIRFDRGAVTVEPGHAKGDAAVRAPAGDLLLWLWGRVPLDGLPVFGDPAAALALRDVTTF
jgi:predicted lipid carrier protein YhbT